MGTRALRAVVTTAILLWVYTSPLVTLIAREKGDGSDTDVVLLTIVTASSMGVLLLWLWRGPRGLKEHCIFLLWAAKLSATATMFYGTAYVIRNWV